MAFNSLAQYLVFFFAISNAMLRFNPCPPYPLIHFFFLFVPSSHFCTVGDHAKGKITLKNKLTQTRWEIQPYLTHSKWNMCEHFGLKLHLLYLHTQQIFIFKSLQVKSWNCWVPKLEKLVKTLGVKIRKTLKTLGVKIRKTFENPVN